MSKIPFNKPKKTNHPVIQEYEDLLNISHIPREEWDQKFLEFYKKNVEFIDDIENLNTNLAIARVIGMKIIYSRILDDKSEYKAGFPIAKDLEALSSRLTNTYHNYQDTCLNAKKWIGVSMGRNKKYLASNKVFKEIIKLDANKEFYIGWISGNYCRAMTFGILYPIFTICSIVFIINAICSLIGNYSFYIYKPYSTIASLLFFIAILLYFNIDKLIRYLVEKKYK